MVVDVGGRASCNGTDVGTAGHDVQERAHLLFVSTHFRSHFRPMLFMALSLAERYMHLAITIYVSAEVLPIVDEERRLYGRSAARTKGHGQARRHRSAQGRVRVVGLKQTLALMKSGVSTAQFASPSASPSSYSPSPSFAPWSLHQHDGSSEWWSSFAAVYHELPTHLRRFWKRRRASTTAPAGANGSAGHRRVNGFQRGRAGSAAFCTSDDERVSRAMEEDAEISPFTCTPTLLVFDFLMDIPHVVNSMVLDPHDPYPGLKTFGYSPGPAAWALRRLSAPDIQDKLADLENLLSKQSDGLSTDLTSLAKGAEDILTKTDGSIIDVAGCYRCFDYELLPQLGAMPINAGRIYIVYKAAQHLRHCDGVIFSTSPEFEPGVAERLQKELGKPVYQIGPQFPDRVWSRLGKPRGETNFEQKKIPVARAAEKANAEVLHFLENALKRLGHHRVLYISFGSVYSMERRPDMVKNLIRVLLDFNQRTGNSLPFIFATTTTSEMIPSCLRDQAAEAQVGMFCQFAPQHLILSHAATGWFLTHGGANGVHEAVVSRVPLIFWPVTTDQPLAAAQMTLGLGCGVELLQVRTGPSVQKPTLRGVQHSGGSPAAIEEELCATFAMITASPGEKGQACRIRDKMERLAQQVRISHESPDGRCARATDALAAHF